jgi:hypothetical protein
MSINSFPAQSLKLNPNLFLSGVSWLGRRDAWGNKSEEMGDFGFWGGFDCLCNNCCQETGVYLTETLSPRTAAFLLTPHLGPKPGTLVRHYVLYRPSRGLPLLCSKRPPTALQHLLESVEGKQSARDESEQQQHQSVEEGARTLVGLARVA